MKEVENLIYSRMTGDTTGAQSLGTLLGSISGRIRCGFQNQEPKVPQIIFHHFSGGPGILTGNFARTWEEFYQFIVYANNHPDIVFRLKRLFDGWCFTVPGGYTQLGTVTSVWDWEGGEGWDENLEVMVKQLRFRFFSVPKPQDPI